MQKRSVFTVGLNVLAFIRNLGGANPASRGPTKRHARSDHAHRRTELRLRRDLGGGAAQIFRAGGRARQNHSGAEQLHL